MEAITKHNPKYFTKRYKGFLKQSLRQDCKNEYNYVEIKPTILSYNLEEGCYLPLDKCFRNNKWGGMNLKVLKNRECNQDRLTVGMYCKCNIVNGKYVLSRNGKQILKRKRENKK